MDNIIGINKYLAFNKDYGKFELTDEGMEILCRQKHVVCSSNAIEWCNHFICELMDLYSGSSIYNHAIGSIKHENEFSKFWICGWIEDVMKKEWGIKVFSMFEKIIDDLPVCE